MIPSKATLPLIAAALAACDFTPDDPEPVPVTLELTWASHVEDGLLALVVHTPPATARFFPELDVCARAGHLPATITAIHHQGAPVAHSTELAHCVTIDPRMASLAPGDPLDVTAVTADGTTTLATVIPAIDPPPAHHALAAVATPDGTLWTATVHHGLVGLTPGGALVHYPGVLSSLPYDPQAREPQSPFITAIAPAAGRALWLGTATTGVSWFDPGIDPVDPADDTWIHGQPMPATSGLEADLAQTTLAIAPDAHDATALWIASPAGLHHARLRAETIDVVTVADGPALSVAVDDDGRVWAGFSTQVRITLEDPDVAGGTPTSLPTAPGALLVLAPGADPHDPTGADLTWLMEDEDAVTALTVRHGHTWIGTPYGLLRAAFSDAGPTLTPITEGLELGLDLAVVDLAPAREGLWLAARAECQADRGLLLRLDLDDAGAVTAVHDLSDRGFGERDFTSVHELDDGRVIVSTLVPALDAGIIPSGTARGCEVPLVTTRTADLYVLDPRGGAAARFGTGVGAGIGAR